VINFLIEDGIVLYVVLIRSIWHFRGQSGCNLPKVGEL